VRATINKASVSYRYLIFFDTLFELQLIYGGHCLVFDVRFLYTTFRKLGLLPKLNIRGPFEKLVDWQQCAAVMQREAVTLCQVVVVGVT
jgi:hypothetical protein